MGRVKDMMIEAMEYDWEETSVSFTCPICGELSDGNAEVPMVLENSDYDLEIIINLNCVSCGERFDAEFRKIGTNSKIKLIDHPETFVRFEPVYYEVYDDEEWAYDPYFYDQPVSPFAVFKEAHDELIHSIDLHGQIDGTASMNRMFFVQSFSIFEAYLCDCYLNLVFLNDNHTKLFVRQHKEVKNLSFSISTMLNQNNLTAEEIVKKKLTQIIKETLFHNLAKAEVMFRFYKISLFLNNEAKDLLFNAVEYRHHAVHRNGCDLEGNTINVYTKRYVLSILNAMMQSAEYVDENIEDIF